MPAPGSLPADWRVAAKDDGVLLVHAPSFLAVVGMVGITTLLAIFVGAGTYVGVESTTKGAISMFLGMLLLPAFVLALAIVPMLRGGASWRIFPSGTVALRGRWHKHVVELGAPVSVMVEPLDHGNAYVPPGPESEQRLVLRGPRQAVVVAYAQPSELLPLRDALRRELKALGQ